MQRAFRVQNTGLTRTFCVGFDCFMTVFLRRVIK